MHLAVIEALKAEAFPNPKVGAVLLNKHNKVKAMRGALRLPVWSEKAPYKGALTATANIESDNAKLYKISAPP